MKAWAVYKLKAVSPVVAEEHVVATVNSATLLEKKL